MTKEEALKLLGLDTAKCDLTVEIVTRMYRRALVAHHPDTRAALDGAPVVRPGDLQEARAVMRRVVAGQEFPCGQCKGVGTVPAKLGRRTCSACKGTGDRQ